VNRELYPQSANAYDSLAEAYVTKGEKQLAIANYKKSLELNPQNTNAVGMLKKLER
jgi:Tfp pilus assembly protein PilF